ncbi:tyrosine-protein kinase HCK-like, partial [Mercenaria mercenaria]|uniref:tyrosine-protein kinase HCK-like n=1 Tax=Mercenaria mercenaria TaxID=6596 RepID=UPI00234F737A
MDQETDRYTRWKLKKINKCWFLDVDGKLKGMNILKFANDVYMEDNIIFADDKMYQLTKSNNDVLITEIQDICQTDKPSECERKEPFLNVEKEELHADGNDRERGFDMTLKENHEIHLNVNQDAIQSSSTWELTPTEDTENDDKIWSDPEKEMNHELGSDLYVPEEEEYTINEDDISTDSEQEEDYELGSEQYVDLLKEGKISGFFKRIKKIVKRKPSLKQESIEKDKEDYDCNLSQLKKNTPVDDAFIVCAMYDFDAVKDDDISFRRGDKLEVDEKSSRDCDWWAARHLTTGEKGYIPSNFVTKDEYSPQSQDWWYNVDRKEAENQLLLPGNPTGTFLMRESEGIYVLSVRDFDSKTNDACVRHYKIRRLENGRFCISPKRTFGNMLDLIFHYRNVADGLSCKLESSCPQIRPLVQFRELEVSRESVKLLKKIGGSCFAEVYAGKWRKTVDVAVKALKQGQMTADDFLAEANLMHHLRHNKLVQLMAVCTISEPIWIITELMIHGALLDYLRKDEGKTLGFYSLVDMTGQIADGMAYLGTENIVHRDLRAANILVGDHNEVKVAGFGLAKVMQKDIYEGQG